MSVLEFNEMVIGLKSPLKNFAFKLTGDREDAQDLVQETYYRAISNRDKFNEGTNIKAWLMTIMRNIFINNYRKNKKQSTITDISENSFLINSVMLLIGNTAERNFVLNDLYSAVNQLEDAYKIPFEMYFNGFKYDEIAEELLLPIGTVKSRIFFARKQMQQYLESKGFNRY